MIILEFLLDLIALILILIIDVLVILVLLSFKNVFDDSILVGVIMLIMLGFPLVYVIFRFNQAVFNNIF